MILARWGAPRRGYANTRCIINKKTRFALRCRGETKTQLGKYRAPVPGAPALDKNPIGQVACEGVATAPAFLLNRLGFVQLELPGGWVDRSAAPALMPDFK